FLLSQLIFGVTMPAVVLGSKGLPRVFAGIAGGLAGGAAMAVPAVSWAAGRGRGFWYPINLLAGLLLPGPGSLEGAWVRQIHAGWSLVACVVHALLSISSGVLFALVTPRLPPIPGPVVWGALILPLLWTGISYGLMGVVNPVLQDRVSWAWFIASQFLFGVAA